MRITRYLGLGLALIASIWLTAGCSRSKEPSGGAPAVGRPPTVLMDAGDNMKFSITRIEAVPGDRITLTLRNVGRMPKGAMAHNFVLLKLGVDARAYAMAAMAATAHEYLPEEKTDEVIVHTRMLGPGEADTVVIEVPAQAGAYTYLCSFPGHYLNGMAGELVVK